MAAEGPRAGTIPLDSARGRWILGVTVLGSAIVFLESTVINVALPTIARDLDAEVADLQWVLNGYLLTLAALILIGGSLGDRYGRRRIYIIGVVWFVLASAVCALATGPQTLIAARLLQGVGGALLTPGSLSILETALAPKDRAKAIGSWSGLTAMAVAAGPPLGGWLVQAVSWRAIFLINLPLGVLVILAARRHVPESCDETATEERPDVAGALTAALALGGLTYALIEAPGRGVASAPVLVALVAGVACLVGFLWRESTAAAPMLPLGMFASRQFSSANALTFVVYGALGGSGFLLAAFLQVTMGYSALAAGTAQLPVTFLLLFLSGPAGALAQRIGPRIPLTAGPALIAAGMLLMHGIGVGEGYVTSVLPPLIVFGLGLAATVAPITATALATADRRHAGVASGVNNAVARTAQLVAVAVLPVAVGLTGPEFNEPGAMADGFRTATLITAAVAGCGALFAWFTIRADVLERAGETDLTQ